MTKSRLLQVGSVVLFLALLAGCKQVAASPTGSRGETSLALGGGPIVSTGTPTEGVVVVGTATVSAEPEVAYVTFGVEIRGDNPASVMDEAARKMDAALAAAREAGIGDEDLQTVGYNLWVETVYDPEKGIPTGEVVYHLSHFVRAKVRDLERLSNLLSSVVEAGANSISEVSFSVEDPQGLITEARQAALRDAQSRAEQIAGVLGFTLGKPVLVQEISGGYVETVRAAMGGGAMEAAIAPVPISPGAFSVSVSIQVVYEIP